MAEHNRTPRNPLYIENDPHETAINCAAVVAYMMVTDPPDPSTRAGNGHALILECVSEALEQVAHETDPSNHRKLEVVRD